jgi:ketosteroid isomerase-like protein
MTAAHLDLVRSICAAWERGDWSSTELAHPDIEFVLADGPSPSPRTGVANMVTGWRDFLSAWEKARIGHRLRELDDERVLVLLPRGAGGRADSIWGELGSRGANVIHIRDRKVTRLFVYFELERAIADLGVSPETDDHA